MVEFFMCESPAREGGAFFLIIDMDKIIRTEFTSTPNYLQVVSLAEAKQQLRIPSGITTEDDIHEAYIASACDHIERVTGRLLCPRDLTLWLDGDDLGGVMPLPHSPLVITEVAFKDADGAYAASTDFDAALQGQTPWIRFTNRPDSDGFGRIRLTCTGGFAAGSCPPALKQAVLLLVVHYDENRSETTIPVPARVIPKGVDALINPYRNTYMS
jgi:uncharacterized phiE125 gp8 family phage protein